MKYKNFEDLPVWNVGIDLTVKVFELTEDPAFRQKGDIGNQIQRASLSVPNNIAEGFERGTTPELLQFLYYAKGSAGEVRSICFVMEKLPFLKHLKSEISDLKSLARTISRQLGGWAFSLQESDIPGTRHLTTKSKDNYHRKNTANSFMENLKKTNEENLQRIIDERKK